jgi:hypothetical protein
VPKVIFFKQCIKGKQLIFSNFETTLAIKLNKTALTTHFSSLISDQMSPFIDITHKKCRFTTKFRTPSFTPVFLKIDTQIVYASERFLLEKSTNLPMVELAITGAGAISIPAK